MPNESLKLPAYGGQALIEGILMRGKTALAAAYRAPDGEIIVQTEMLKGIYKSKIRNIPFLRGLILLWDALGLGIRYLTESANVQTGENEKIKGGELIGSLIFSFSLAVLIFFVTPAFLSELAEKYLSLSAWVSNVMEGIFRLILIVLYIWGIGKMKDIARVFAYHGAEHKTINTFEAGLPLTVENVKKSSLQHPRCGTSFILTLVIISIVIFALIGPLPMLWRIISRILLIPVIAGIAYEYTRWASNHLDSKFVRWLITPNMALQNLTTREPDEGIIEVAITSFNAMIELETASPETK